MEKIQLLYIDDEPDSLTTVKMGLEDRGYEVLTADNGAGALELLKTHTPDVIITDLRMSPMNGFELFQEVKKIPRFAETPFFFLTAVDDYLAQKYGQTLGVDAYLTKPIELEYFDSFIKTRLSKT
jgi:response regulator RpfG family c-di-GMP phosphodiesterase